jgi:hypothetical protein
LERSQVHRSGFKGYKSFVSIYKFYNVRITCRSLSGVETDVFRKFRLLTSTLLSERFKLSWYSNFVKL